MNMFDDEHQHFMQEALVLADYAASLGEVPVGAVVVHNGEIVGRGWNTRELAHDPTGHAELAALRNAARRLGTWRLENCKIYVTLEPCAMCAGALVLSRIGTCIFGCRDSKGGFCGSLGDLSSYSGLNHHYSVVSGVLEEECGGRLTAFFRALRARKRQ